MNIYSNSYFQVKLEEKEKLENPDAEENDYNVDDFDEVTGYHFIESTTLFVAYIYVISG